MEIEHSVKEYLVMLRVLKDAGLTCIIMINRFCSHCGSYTGYDSTKESSSHWCSLVTRDNKDVFIFFAVVVMQSKLIRIQNGIRLLMLNGKMEKSCNIKRMKFLS